MPTPKYRLVEVIIHEGESAYAGHYLSVNLETKEVFNDQFPNRKYMKYSEFSEYEAREKYGKLPMTLQVKDMMKKMIGRSSEDVEDRLIKAGNIFYYRREDESSSNPVTDQMETKSDPGALDPNFLMTKSQVAEVSKRINQNDDDDIGKLLDDLEKDIDTTNFFSMYDDIKLSPRKDIITPKKIHKEEKTSKPKRTPKGKKEIWITTPNKEGGETLYTPEKVEVENTTTTPKKDIKSLVTNVISNLSPKKLKDRYFTKKNAESTPNKVPQESSSNEHNSIDEIETDKDKKGEEMLETPKKAQKENTPTTPKTPNKVPQESGSDEDNLIDEIEINKVIHGPLLEQQCSCSINGVPCIKCGINPVCHFCSQMRRRDECNNCAFQKVIFSPIKIPQSTPKKKIQPTSIETHKKYHNFQENSFQSMEEAEDTGQNLLVTSNKAMDLSTPSKSSRKDDIQGIATSKTFVAAAESPALKRTLSMKNKKDADADESTSSCHDHDPNNM